MTEPVELKAGEVTQEDREAANALWHNVTSSGDIDDIARAFARHRLAHSAPPREPTRETDPRDDFNHPDHDAVCGWCGKIHSLPISELLRRADEIVKVRFPDGISDADQLADVLREVLAAPQANNLAVGEEG